MHMNYVSLILLQDDPLEVLDKTFAIADDEFKIPKLLDATDMDNPDELSVMTYVSYFRQKDKVLILSVVCSPAYCAI
jgi:tryptophanyl-tRNA synthetase